MPDRNKIDTLQFFFFGSIYGRAKFQIDPLFCCPLDNFGWTNFSVPKSFNFEVVKTS